jgi:hypothetical protein
MLAQDRNRIVEADPEKDVGIEDAGRERAGGLRLPSEGNVDTENESSGTGCRAFQERAPRCR